MLPILGNLQHAEAPTLCIAVIEEADMDTSSEVSLTALSRSSQRPLMRGAAPVAVGEDITAGGLRRESPLRLLPEMCP